MNTDKTPIKTNSVAQIIFKTRDLKHFCGQSAFKYHGVNTASRTRHRQKRIFKIKITPPKSFSVYYAEKAYRVKNDKITLYCPLILTYFTSIFNRKR